MNKTRQQTGKTPPRDERRARYAILWQEDMKALRRPRGYKALARDTKWNVNTVKSDLRRMNNEATRTAAQQEQPAPPTNNRVPEPAEVGVFASPPLVSHPPVPVRSGDSLDYWDDHLKKVAQIVTASFSQTLRGEIVCECGRRHQLVKDPALALRLGSTFARLYTAKMGGDRVSVFMALNQPPPPIREVDIRDVIAALQSHDTGSSCLLCGAPKETRHRGGGGGGPVIDAEVKEIKDEGG